MTASATGRGCFPYDGIAAKQSWQPVVGNLASSAIDPHQGMRSRFRFNRSSKIASAGSCFAQRLSESLQLYGFNYLITEPGPAWLPPDLRCQYQYGSYSARYGNLYSSLQLLQLLQRAYGEFEPIEQVWQGPEGLLDPYRPRIQPGGFASREEFDADRESHFAAVRRLCEQAELFTFTLGLTEVWRDPRDGAVFPVCPGRGYGEFDPDRHQFHNLGLAENIEHMSRSIEKLLGVNPGLKILLTVSPVPLAATMEDRHVLQSTVYSKSVLRVVADEMRRSFPQVDYFASYEIITSTFNNADYFRPDRRNVTEAGVDHVLRSFFNHFSETPYADLVAIAQTEASFEAQPCDEEELQRYLNQDFKS